MTSGLPVNLTYSPSAAVPGERVPTYRPNLSGDVYAPDGEQSITNWFNKANVTIPTDVTQPFGNAPRNVARGPALYVARSRAAQELRRWSAGSRLEFRIEAFNVLNKTNFGAPNSNVSSDQLRHHHRRWRRRRGRCSSASSSTSDSRGGRALTRRTGIARAG